jgi:hypothetical protein
MTCYVIQLPNSLSLPDPQLPIKLYGCVIIGKSGTFVIKVTILYNLPIINIRNVVCKKGCTRLAAASDKVYQLLVHGRWFSPGTPASSTTKTGRHDIAEILLKVFSYINIIITH